MDAWRQNDGKTRLWRAAFDLLAALGAVYPAFVIGFELSTRLCASEHFDPIPTWTQTVLVSLVPATNFVLWLRLRRALYSEDPKDSSPLAAPWPLFFSGLSIGVATLYTIMFLPVTPVAVIAIVIYGMGLLPLAPMASLGAAVTLFIMARRRAAAAKAPAPALSRFWIGAALAVAILLGLDAQPAITRLGTSMALSDLTKTRNAGLSLLRAVGDRELMLRFCYTRNPPPSGLLSLVVNELAPLPAGGRLWSATNDLRLVYYRATGVAFNTVPMPELGKGARRARFSDFQFDADQGAATVGGRLSGLTMTSSRLDGSISGDNATAYLEWTFEFGNASLLAREARLQLALPPHAVVSRATLWINGEERQAAYGERGTVRAAYQKVVRARRDPLLVTSTGAGRVLAQAFPVPPGGSIKFKLGITQALELISMDKARLTLPLIDDRNFSFAPNLKHMTWLESRRPIRSSPPLLTATTAGEHVFRLRGELSDRELGRTRPAIMVERDPALVKTWGRIDGGRPVIQEIVSSPRIAPTALLVLVDGSANMKPHIEEVARILAGAPASAKIGLMIASEMNVSFPPADWTGDHKDAALAALREINLVGGQDNAKALEEALLILEPYAGARLLWVHAAQPERFPVSAVRLEQTASRLSRFPEIALYAVEPGRNDALPDAPWAWRARPLATTGSIEADLKAYFDSLFGPGEALEIRRSQGDAPESVPRGSEHVVRLWARDQVMALTGGAGQPGRKEAVKLAAAHRLVTPVTGAVVLQNKTQFDQNSLQPVQSETVPAVPEPRVWLMLALAGGLLAWVALRQRRKETA
jgi:hypothetical protein